ncbi:Ankyrin repeat family protein [Trifolium repens]|nr:Ankyrin repeat family protein [Trifolium repens]
MAFEESSSLMSPDHVKAAVTEFARGFNHSYYQPLHIAILKGDWESTKAFLDRDPSALTAKITTLGRTALHVAAVGAQWILIEKLVQLMPANMLAEPDLMGYTCLHYVAMGKSVDAAKALVIKNPSLTQETDFKGFTPLIHSITSTRCKEMVWYLVLNTTDERPGCPFSGPCTSRLVALLSDAGFHDITMHLLQRYPNLATISDSNGSIILNVLSKLPSHFQSRKRNKFRYNERGLYKYLYKCIPEKLEYLSPNQSFFGNTIWTAIEVLAPGIEEVRDEKFIHISAVRLVEFVFSQTSTINDYQFRQSFVTPKIIFNATSCGIVEILKTCFHLFPDLVWTHIPNEGYLIQIAIKNRQKKVFRLLCKMPIICKLLAVLALDESNKTTSHLAARFSSKTESIYGAAFQMQRELLWFKEVEELDDPLHKQVKNKDGKTPREVFKKEHKALRDEAKDWIKDRSNAGMLVAALIATITFAAAITVPGGNNQDKGIPIFLHDIKFTVFIFSDTIAFLSSMTSLLIFLEIMKGHYTEDEYVMAMPLKLIMGSDSLSVSVVATIVAFIAALSMFLEHRFKHSTIYISVLASFPIALSSTFQFPILGRMLLRPSRFY